MDAYMNMRSSEPKGDSVTIKSVSSVACSSAFGIDDPVKRWR